MPLFKIQVYLFLILIGSIVSFNPLPLAQAKNQGSMVGLVTDAHTAQRLSGATVVVAGQTTITNSKGYYRFDNLLAGPQVATVSLNGYGTTTRRRMVIATQTVWNSVALTPDTQPPPPTPQTGALIGLITAVESGERLGGATVSVAGQTMVTSERGIYRFENVPVGVQIVSVEKEGYDPAQKSREVVAGEIRWNSLELSQRFSGCPTQSNAVYELIPILNQNNDHPDFLHGDLNLSQRGYSPTSASPTLQDYAGNSDPHALQLAGLFEPNHFPGISAVYRANHWQWGCGEHGCRGEVITEWPVTVMGLATSPGQSIYLPERSLDIYQGRFKAVVLYAEAQRLTLGYTREDSVAHGYAVHLENVCVDPNLLSLYQAQIDASGFRATGLLPALTNNQQLGVANGSEIQIAVRDRGAFLDPRSRKDWWRGF